MLNSITRYETQHTFHFGYHYSYFIVTFSGYNLHNDNQMEVLQILFFNITRFNSWNKYLQLQSLF